MENPSITISYNMSRIGSTQTMLLRMVKKMLRRLVMGFLLDGEVLYKKGKDHILLRCVDSSVTNRIVEEIHEGVCGTHANGHRMAG